MKAYIPAYGYHSPRPASRRTVTKILLLFFGLGAEEVKMDDSGESPRPTVSLASTNSWNL